jgi:hypothetical protein
MPFGMKNAMSTFQRCMNNTLSGLIYRICAQYVDDTIVWANTVDEMISNLTQIFDRLEQEGLTLRWDKCRWFEEELDFLGWHVSKSGVSPNPKHIAAISEYPRPRTQKDVKRFLGMVSYFRKSIKDFAKIANPLTELLRQNVTFAWNDERQTSFDALKATMIQAPILAYPRWDETFIITTDGSLKGTGYYLSQVHDGVERVIAYGGKTLTSAETRYSAHEVELLALIQCVKQFEAYLVLRPFKVRTDSTAIIWLLKQNIGRGRVSRWIIFLSSYDFEIIHVKGDQNVVADALSRAFINSVTTMGTGMVSTDPVDIREAQRSDADLMKIISFFEHGTALSQHEAYRLSSMFTLDENQVLWFIHKGAFPHENPMKLVIPSAYRLAILESSHDCNLAGHLGFWKTYAKLRQRAYWPKMYNDTKNYVASCVVCQKFKPRAGIAVAPLQPDRVTEVFQKVSIDFTGPYITTKGTGNKYILTMVEHLTKYAMASACKAATAAIAAEAFFEKVTCFQGKVEFIQSDGGSHFTSKMISEFYKILDAKKITSSPYSPRTMGQVEQQNYSLVSMIARMVDHRKDLWDRFLSPALMAYNTSPHTSTKVPPFDLLFGRVCKLPSDLLAYKIPNLPPKDSEILSELAQHIHEIQRSTKAVQEADKLKSKIRFDEENKTKMTSYEIGDRILVLDGTRRKKRNKKFLESYTGPWTITERLGPVTYKIDTRQNSRIGDTVHVNRTKRWVDRNPISANKHAVIEGQDGCPVSPPTSQDDATLGSEHMSTHGETELSRTMGMEKKVNEGDQTTTVADENEIDVHQHRATMVSDEEIDIHQQSPPSPPPPDIVQREGVSNVPPPTAPASTFIITNHRRTRDKHLYLLNETGAPEVVGRWINSDDPQHQLIIQRYKQLQKEQEELIDSRAETNSVRSNRTTDNSSAWSAPPSFHKSNTTWLTRICNMMPLLLTLFIYLSLLGPVRATTTQPSVNLGDLYDCSVPITKTIHALPNKFQCEKSFKNENVEKFRASVKKFRKISTHINLFYCEARTYKKVCFEAFFGSKSKQTHTTLAKVTAKQCSIAVWRKVTPYGRLHRVSQNVWESKETRAYTCLWERSKTEQYTIFRVTKYPGLILSDEPRIKQKLTLTKCFWRNTFCRPKERPFGVITWRKLKHVTHSFHDLGHSWVRKFGNFIILEKFGLSGSIIKQKEGTFVLDNTYVIQRDFSTSSLKDNITWHLMNFSAHYAQSVSTNIPLELFQARVVAKFLKEDSELNFIANLLCNMQSDIQRLQMHTFRSLTDTSHDLIFDTHIKSIQRSGDAVMITTCKPISEYEILWNSTLHGKCYYFYPVKVGNITQFLELSTRRLHASSHRISCSHRPSDIFIRDNATQYWHYNQETGFRKVSMPTENFERHPIHLPRLATFSDNLTHFTGTHLHRTSLLSLITEHRDVLRELLDYRENSTDNTIVNGIARSLAITADAIVGVPARIFHLLAGTAVDLTNDTVITANGIADAITGVFSFTDGPLNFVFLLTHLVMIGMFIKFYFDIRKLKSRRCVPQYIESHMPRGQGNKLSQTNPLKFDHIPPRCGKKEHTTPPPEPVSTVNSIDPARN